MDDKRTFCDADQPLVLVVEDSPTQALHLKFILEQRDFRVETAENGKIALAALKTITPDVILTDVTMPEMNGYEFCQRLRFNGDTHDIPVIFISAGSKDFNAPKAFQAGAVDYLSKPFSTDEIYARLTVHIELRKKIKELEAFNTIMLDREMRIIELKKEVNELAIIAGKQEEPYPEV